MISAHAGFGPLTSLKKIGHITPSSNTAVEPMTALLNASLADRVSHHFTRIRVTQITLGEGTASQFELDRMLAAAELLADAPLNAIVWNGTAASWLGIERDEGLCSEITDRTGLPSSTATLAFHAAFQQFGFRKIALAVPYTREVTEQIASVYAQRGIQVVSSAHLGQSVNAEFADNGPDPIRALLRDADSDAAECIAVVCTNFPATPLVDEMERELGKPILDSIAVTFWQACRLAGVTPHLEGWGALMGGALEP